MRLHLIEVPYDSGRFDERMGSGPRLLAAELPPRLAGDGLDVVVTPIRLAEGFVAEVAAVAALQPLVRSAVLAARAAGELPVVLSGNCGNAALGTMSALPASTGVVWLDAHGDFNTPETSPSGFVDGMCIATLTGRCWPAVAQRFTGFTAVADERIVLLGARDLDPAEEQALRASAVTWLPPAEVRDAARRAAALDAIAERCDGLYLHLDLDVLDASALRANVYAGTGGLTLEDVLQLIAEARRRMPIVAAALTALDPRADEPAKAVEVAARLLAAIG